MHAILNAPNLTSRTGWLHQAENTQDVALIAELQSKLLDLATLSPTYRGLSFEHFLTEMFVAFRLAPKGSSQIRPSIGP